MKFGKLVVRKIVKIIATRCHILRLKCTKFDSRRLSVRPSVRLLDGVWHWKRRYETAGTTWHKNWMAIEIPKRIPKQGFIYPTDCGITPFQWWIQKFWKGGTKDDVSRPCCHLSQMRIMICTRYIQRRKRLTGNEILRQGGERHSRFESTSASLPHVQAPSMSSHAV